MGDYHDVLVAKTRQVREVMIVEVPGHDSRTDEVMIVAIRRS
jgi:hypothetical protein